MVWRPVVVILVSVEGSTPAPELLDVLIDNDGAGRGLHTDSATAPAAGRYDLTTVVAHELNHAPGLDDLDDAGHDSLMK